MDSDIQQTPSKKNTADAIDIMKHILTLNINEKNDTLLNAIKNYAVNISDVFPSNTFCDQGLRSIIGLIRQFLLVSENASECMSFCSRAIEILDFASFSYEDKLSLSVADLKSYANNLDNLFWYCSIYNETIDTVRNTITYNVCNRDDILTYVLLNGGNPELLYVAV